MKALILAAALALGCGLAPPTEYSIDPAFSEVEAAAIQDGVQSWCDETGDCPDPVAWPGGARFELVDDLPEDAHTLAICPPRYRCVTDGRHNRIDNSIEIARNRGRSDDPAYLQHVAAHEWGHNCVIGHTRTGMMAAAMSDSTWIDALAVVAWNEGCH